MRHDFTRLSGTGRSALAADGVRSRVRVSYLIDRWVQAPIFDPAREADT
jgi:hypothetical protein